MLDECFQRLFSSMDPAVMKRVAAKHEKEQNEQLTPIYNVFDQCLPLLRKENLGIFKTLSKTEKQAKRITPKISVIP